MVKKDSVATGLPSLSYTYVKLCIKIKQLLNVQFRFGIAGKIIKFVACWLNKNTTFPCLLIPNRYEFYARQHSGECVD